MAENLLIVSNPHKRLLIIVESRGKYMAVPINKIGSKYIDTSLIGRIYVYVKQTLCLKHFMSHYTHYANFNIHLRTLP